MTQKKIHRTNPFPARKAPIQRFTSAMGNKRSGNKQYVKERDSFLLDYNLCLTQILGQNDPAAYAALLKNCEKKATTVDHSGSNGRRGDALTNNKFFIGLCAPCHQFIDTYTKTAKNLGYKI
jgi:hypothetical protein